MKKTILIIVLSLFVGVTLYSQDSAPIVRIAYVNRAEIFNSFPQVATIEKELKQLQTEYEAEFVSMTKEYERKVKAYLEKSKQMSEPIKLARQTEITELEARMDMYKKRYNEELEKHRLERFALINQLIDEAIRVVCQREQITILFDQAQPLYMSAQCVELTSLVKVELGL
jgi:Skp family chaperone for outer membrane proteins